MECRQINAYFKCNNPAYKYFASLSNKYLCAWVTRSSLLTAPGSRTINNHQFGNVKSYQPASCTLRPTRAYNKIHMSPSLSNALIFWSDARNTRHPGGNLLQFGIKTSALATLRWGNVAPAHYQSARQIMNVSRCLWEELCDSDMQASAAHLSHLCDTQVILVEVSATMHWFKFKFGRELMEWWPLCRNSNMSH